MIMYSLAVVNGTPCMPSLSSLLNNAAALFILTYADTQVFYCQHLLWNLCSMLNFDTFVGRQEDKSIE